MQLAGQKHRLWPARTPVGRKVYQAQRRRANSGTWRIQGFDTLQEREAGAVPGGENRAGLSSSRARALAAGDEGRRTATGVAERGDGRGVERADRIGHGLIDTGVFAGAFRQVVVRG